MNTRLLITFGIVACLCIATGNAQATTNYFMSGQACDAAAGNVPDGTGFLVQSTTLGSSFTENDVTAACPVTYVVPGAVVIDDATVNYYDSDPTNAISCYLEYVNWDGTATTSATEYSCPGVGDGSCSSNSYPGNSGLGQLDFSSNPLSMSNKYPISAGIVCTMDASGGTQQHSQRIYGYKYDIN